MFDGTLAVELARLLGILTSTSAVRRAIVEILLERSRAPLDGRIPRDIVWSTAVSPAFNEPFIVPSVQFYSAWTDYVGRSFEFRRLFHLTARGRSRKVGIRIVGHRLRFPTTIGVDRVRTTPNRFTTSSLKLRQESRR
jgi:hypothetical protein